jgi:DNA-directed RNA polymerase subunit beta
MLLDVPSIRDTLIMDRIDSERMRSSENYRKLRPSNTPTPETLQFFRSLFSKWKNTILGCRRGRGRKLHYKLGLAMVPTDWGSIGRGLLAAVKY